jgi:hypothetical protein
MQVLIQAADCNIHAQNQASISEATAFQHWRLMNDGRARPFGGRRLHESYAEWTAVSKNCKLVSERSSELVDSLMKLRDEILLSNSEYVASLRERCMNSPDEVHYQEFDLALKLGLPHPRYG